MPEISEEEIGKIKDMFSEQLGGEVTILFFESEEVECDYCDDTRDILEKITPLDDRINFEVHQLESDRAEEYGIDRVPATIFVDEEGNDLGIHFYGIPSGYEFNTIIEDIIDVSNDMPDLSPEIIEEAQKIDKDVVLQVFITPTCPYCPRSVRVAHQLALVNPKIRGEMIEAIEFQELSNRFNVSGVPKTVINEGAAEQVGAVPADTILEQIQEALQ